MKRAKVLMAETMVASMLLILLLEGASVINYQRADKILPSLTEAIKSQDDQAMRNQLRKMVRTIDPTNLKMIGIDIGTLELKFGTVSYYDGDLYEIKLMPLWPYLRDYAYILHNEDEHQKGIGYIRGDTHITPEKGVISYARQLVKTPPIETRVIVLGKGDVDTTDAKETTTSCNKLLNRWDDYKDTLESEFDSKIFVAITSDMYCPTELKRLDPRLYREIAVEGGHADDGTPVDVIRNPKVAAATSGNTRRNRNKSRKNKKDDKFTRALNGDDDYDSGRNSDS